MAAQKYLVPLGTAISATQNPEPQGYGWKVALAINPDGSYSPLELDSSGNLNVNVQVGGGGSGGGGSNAAASNTGSAVPAAADYLGFSNAGGTLLGVSAANPLPVGGTLSIGGTPTVALSSGGTVAVSSVGGTVLTSLTGTPTVALSAGGTIAVTGAYQAVQPVSGTLSISGTTTVTASNLGTIAPAAAPGQMGVIGAVYNSTLNTLTTGQAGALACDANCILYTHANGGTQAVSIVAASSSGASQSRTTNTASSAMATLVKSSAGQVYGWVVSNGGSATVYFRLYNLSAAPTVGSSTGIVATVPVPAGGTVTYSNDVGIVMGTGIAFDVTAGSFADTDTTTIASANTVSVTILSK